MARRADRIAAVQVDLREGLVQLGLERRPLDVGCAALEVGQGFIGAAQARELRTATPQGDGVVRRRVEHRAGQPHGHLGGGIGGEVPDDVTQIRGRVALQRTREQGDRIVGPVLGDQRTHSDLARVRARWIELKGSFGSFGRLVDAAEGPGQRGEGLGERRAELRLAARLSAGLEVFEGLGIAAQLPQGCGSRPPGRRVVGVSADHRRGQGGDLLGLAAGGRLADEVAQLRRVFVAGGDEDVLQDRGCLGRPVRRRQGGQVGAEQGDEGGAVLAEGGRDALLCRAQGGRGEGAHRGGRVVALLQARQHQLTQLEAVVGAIHVQQRRQQVSEIQALQPGGFDHGCADDVHAGGDAPETEHGEDLDLRRVQAIAVQLAGILRVMHGEAILVQIQVDARQRGVEVDLEVVALVCGRPGQRLEVAPRVRGSARPDVRRGAHPARGRVLGQAAQDLAGEIHHGVGVPPVERPRQEVGHVGEILVVYGDEDPCQRLARLRSPVLVVQDRHEGPREGEHGAGVLAQWRPVLGGGGRRAGHRLRQNGHGRGRAVQIGEGRGRSAQDRQRLLGWPGLGQQRHQVRDPETVEAGLRSQERIQDVGSIVELFQGQARAELHLCAVCPRAGGGPAMGGVLHGALGFAEAEQQIGQCGVQLGLLFVRVLCGRLGGGQASLQVLDGRLQIACPGTRGTPEPQGGAVFGEAVEHPPGEGDGVVPALGVEVQGDQIGEPIQIVGVRHPRERLERGMRLVVPVQRVQGAQERANQGQQGVADHLVGDRPVLARAEGGPGHQPRLVGRCRVRGEASQDRSTEVRDRLGAPCFSQPGQQVGDPRGLAGGAGRDKGLQRVHGVLGPAQRQQRLDRGLDQVAVGRLQDQALCREGGGSLVVASGMQELGQQVQDVHILFASFTIRDVEVGQEVRLGQLGLPAPVQGGGAEPEADRVIRSGAQDSTGEVDGGLPALPLVGLGHEVRHQGQLLGEGEAQQRGESAVGVVATIRPMQGHEAVAYRREQGVAVGAQRRVGARSAAPAQGRGREDLHAVGCPGVLQRLEEPVGQGEHLVVGLGLVQRRQQVGQIQGLPPVRIRGDHDLDGPLGVPEGEGGAGA